MTEREPEVRHRTFPVIWIIPVVAALIAGGLAYRAIQSQGPSFKVTFETAAGLEEGKTAIKYKAVDIGIVDEVHVAHDRSHVVVTAELTAAAAGLLVEGTNFWVVRPRVTAGGISGLSTLVSGAYIGTNPGPFGGKRARTFKGLEEPPPVSHDEKGLKLVLEAKRLSDANEGSLVFYRDVTVGRVARHEFSKDGQSISIHLLIEPKFASFVRKNSRFFRAGGLDVDASWRGVNLHLESLSSLIAGGVEFDTIGRPGDPAEDGETFTLHDTEKVATTSHARGRPLRIVLEARQGSLKAGTPVLYREEPVGHVVSHKLNDDARTVGILIEIGGHYAPLIRTNTVFWNASGIKADLGLSGLHVHTESLASLIAGGIAFATPDKPGKRAASGSVFRLQPEEKDDWLKWSPRIPLGRGKSHTAAQKEEEEEKVHHNEEAQKDEKSHHWYHDLLHH